MPITQVGRNSDKLHPVTRLQITVSPFRPSPSSAIQTQPPDVSGQSRKVSHIDSYSCGLLVVAKNLNS